MDIKKILNNLTLEEKINLVTGTRFMFTNEIQRLNIPSIRTSDGPHGLRVQKGDSSDNGISTSEVATSFPTAATSASSWNPDNLYKMGEAISEECKYYGVDILLGPGCNIKRNPLCGRNFEYFSEDPYLTGKMGECEIKGLQDNGVCVSLKHFALNNSENNRFMSDSIVDERAEREIYLKGFEYIIKNAKPKTVMCAYNKANGKYCSENKKLLTDILRCEWGFDGFTMSDWGSVRYRVDGIKAGLDLEMPGDTPICKKWIYDACQNGELDISDLDKAVYNILHFIDSHKFERQDYVDWDKHNNLAKEIAIDSAVLLKNDGMLPLDANDKILVIGDLFEKMRYQGAGSSMINPKTLTTPKNAFDKHNVDYTFVRGYRENQTEVEIEYLNEALEKAKSFDKILVFMGLTDYVESEGCDRENMSLPQNQLDLIYALSNLGKNISVILFGGSPIELPFDSKVSSILNMYLPGQCGGEAVYELVFGEKSPSGRLAETWPIEYEDVPFGKEYGKQKNELYKESIYIGYRYYLSANKKVRYPFGYGLSYTDFEYDNFEIKNENDEIHISCNVKNIGEYDSSEVVQIYVKKLNSKIFRVEKELKAFKKVFVKRTDSQRVELVIKTDDLKYYDVNKKEWILEDGEYEIQINKDCENVLYSKSLNISGEEIELPYSERLNNIYSKLEFDKIDNEVFEELVGYKIDFETKIKPITLESRFSDLKETFFGKILYNAVMGVFKKDLKKAQKMEDGIEKENRIKGAYFLYKILDSNSLRTLSMSAGEKFTYNIAEGFMHMSNGHVLKGIKSFTTKIDDPTKKKEKVKDAINK